MLSSMMFQSTSATPKQPFQSAEADDERSTPWSQRQENLRRQSFMALDAEEEKENTFATEADDIFNQFKNDESSKNRSRVKRKAPTESVAPDTTKRPRVNRPPPLRPRRRSMGVNTRRLSSRIASQNPVTEPSNVGVLGRPPLATKDALSDNSKTPRGASARKRNGREGESVKKSTRKQTDTKRKAGRTGDSPERTFCMGTTENVSNIDLNGIGLNPKTPGTARQRRMSMRGVGNKSARSTRKSSKKLRHQVSEKSRLEEAEKLKNKGNQSFAKQQYEKAIKEYSLAIQLDPDNATYLANRAAALLMLERYDLAIDDCEAALQKRPGYFRAQMRASRAYLAVGRTSHSLQHLNRVIQVPKQTDSKVASQAMETAMKEAYEMIEQVKAYDSLIEKADQALRSEDPVLAKECADEASALSPQSKVVGLIRVTAVLIGVATGVTPLPAGANPAVGGKGLLGEAAHELEMMGFKTCHAQDVARYGHILRNCALTSEAKLFLTASLRLDPSVNEVVQSLEFVKKMEQLLCDGINAFHKNNCETAIALFDQALALDPANKAYNCRMHYRKGAAHLTMHMYAEAVLDCNRALSLVSTYHKARSQRAKALVALGRYTEAARDLEHVLQHNGGDKQTKVDLEAIRRRIDSSEQQQQSASNSSNSSNRNDIPPFHTASESRTSNPAECRSESFGQNMKRSATHGPTTSSSGRYSFHRSNTTGASSTTHQAAGNKSSHTRSANHAGATNGSKFDSNNERHRYFTRSARKPTAAHSGRRKSPRVALRINDPTASHYELLGITTLASASQIKTAFKKLALKFHPDKNSSPSAEAKFKRISEAYGVLSSPGRRRQYDRTQGMHARRQPVF